VGGRPGSRSDSRRGRKRADGRLDQVWPDFLDKVAAGADAELAGGGPRWAPGLVLTVLQS